MFRDISHAILRIKGRNLVDPLNAVDRNTNNDRTNEIEMIEIFDNNDKILEDFNTEENLNDTLKNLNTNANK